MPFSDLPIKLQTHSTQQGTSLNLTNYPLYNLTIKEFDALVKALQDDQNWTELNLTHCGLNKLKPDQLNGLLTASKNMIKIALDKNELSAQSQLLEVVYQALQQLPKLRVFSIQDGGQRASNYYSGLASIPSWRIYQKNDNSFSFLNASQIKDFLQFMEIESHLINYFLDDQKKLTRSSQSILHKEQVTNVDRLIEAHPIIREFHKYRKDKKRNLLVSPPSPSSAIQVLDRLGGTGFGLHYCLERKEYILNMLTINHASCEHALYILYQELPMDTKWHINIPANVSYFAGISIDKLKITYPQNLTFSSYTSYSSAVDKKDPDYIYLAKLNKRFTQSQAQFYDLLHNESALFEAFARLKNILESNKEELKKLVYEFFAVHQLCQYPEPSDNYSDVLKAIRTNDSTSWPKLAQFKQEALSLLNNDPKSVAQKLDSPIELKNIPRDEDKAADRVAIQAKVWWGRAAFYHLNQNSSMGIYWYGRYLYEFPNSQPLLPVSVSDPKTYQAEQRGLYWLRLAATQYQNHLACKYLGHLLAGKQDKLEPANRYQLLLAAEELQLPFVKGGVFKPLESFLTLFPPHSYPAHLWVYWFPKQSAFPSEQAFYLSSLVADNLLPEKTKGNLLRILDTDRGNAVASIGVIAGQSLMQEKNIVTQYCETPLGAELKHKLLPVLAKFLKGNNSSVIDSKIPMKNNPLAVRSAAFGQLFTQTLDSYLTHRKLFNVEIGKNENPSYVAVLIHNLLTHGLEYFQLNGTEIHTVMQDIKQELQDLFFRQQLVNHANSLGFQKALATRLVSYSTTAYLANTTQLSLLRKFGDSQEKTHHDEISIAKKSVYIGALTFETLHIALPIVLAATGVGIPAAFGSSAVIAGLRIALEKIHHYTEKVEGVLAHANIVPGLAHLDHLAHESRLITHNHHAPKVLIEIDTIKHFNNLLSNASVTDIDNVLVLMRHWTTIYQPITDELTETSSTILGTLLVELLLRGITFRLLSEKHNRFERKTALPTTIPGLLDYFNETLWLYSHPNVSDDAQLVTKGRVIFSALDIIFPKKLKTYFADNTIDIAIKPKNLPPRITFTSEVTLIRFASAYEVKQLNGLRHGDSNNAFELTSEAIASLVEWKGLGFEIAYQENNTLAEKIALLSNKIDLLELKSEVQDCININNLIMKRILGENQSHTQETMKVLATFEQQLPNICALLMKFINQLKDPKSTFNTTIPEFLSKDKNLSITVVIKNYINKASAFFILVDRKYKLNLEALGSMPLAEMDDQHLKTLSGDLSKSLEHIPSSVPPEGVSVTTQGIFKADNKPQPQKRAAAPQHHNNKPRPQKKAAATQDQNHKPQPKAAANPHRYHAKKKAAATHHQNTTTLPQETTGVAQNSVKSYRSALMHG